MKTEDTWAGVDQALSDLPGCGDDLFDRLWVKRGLSFELASHETDSFDEYSARLVCASSASVTSKNLFVVLPDNLSHRPALLFATALIRYWYDFRSPTGQTNPVVYPPVLYFGSAVGIREQLAGVRVGNSLINLADVFRQGDVGSRGTAVGRQKSRLRAGGTLDLPRVFTVYSPSDPVKILERHRPKWVAVDCGDVPDTHWLATLLKYARVKGIRVIGWGHNPLSECVALFREHGEVFPWPARVPADYLKSGNATVSRYDDLDTIFASSMVETKVQPFVLAGPSVDRLDEPLGEARRLLLKATRRNVTGRLGSDALRAHWRCLNALSTLSVPLDFYESESRHVWGLEPVESLLRSCEVFREACRQDYVDLSRELDQVSGHLEEARGVLEKTEPSLWEALCQLCIEEPMPDEARLITFLSRARKQLFLLALLARCNLVREDLEEVSTWVASVDDLRRWTRQLTDGERTSEDGALDAPDMNLAWRPLLVGLPGVQLTPKLAPVLTQRNVDILLYPHQGNAFARRMSEWSRLLNPDASKSLQTLRGLGCSCPPNTELPTAVRVGARDSVVFNVRNGRVAGRASVTRLWEPEDETDSIARLLRTVEDPDEEEAPPIEVWVADGGMEADETTQETWCDSALEVNFAGGWNVLFDPDEQVNVLVATPSGTRLDRRYVRSLREDDRLLLIHGQRRQNLYDLIISRIHRNPAIELHVALVRRWQDDFAVAYRRWKRHGELNLDELLAQMRRRGSDLTNSFTLRQWLWRNTLCPHDKEDLGRLAEVLDMGFVKEHYRRIDKAASRLRGLHRGLSNRLNRWLEQETAGTAGQSDEDIIDEDLGLRFGDFRSSLEVLTVEKTATIRGPFLRTTLGRVGRNE